MNDVDVSRAPYQRILRAIGGYLDGEEQGRFRLVEEHDGYALVLESGPEALLKAVHLDLSTLANRADRMVRGKHPYHAGPGKNWSLVSTSHEDVFRALGFELDDARARNVSIDEMLDEMFADELDFEADGRRGRKVDDDE